MTEQLWQRSAGELAEMIRTREVSSREVVDAHLQRIEQVNDHLNAITIVLTDSAVEAADAADKRTTKGEDLPPLHGVPVTVKENIDLAGTPTTWGLVALEQAIPTQDAPIVERIRVAGAIPIGRTNLPEMGLRISTNNPLRGLTRNPWNPELTAGGSSGGEGSAIASGMSPLGLGNDIGGSVRNPAFCCGIASIKPTQGRVPDATMLPPEDPWLGAQLMATNGPMARRVADVRTALQVMSGQHVRDPRSLTVPFDGPEVSKRAALVTDLPGGGVIPAVADAVRLAGQALQAAGYDVEEVSPPEIEHVSAVWAQVLIRGIRGLRDVLGQVMSAEALTLLDQMDASLPTDVMPGDAVHVERSRLGRAWAAFFAERPIVVGPVWPDKPFAHDADLEADSGMDLTLGRLRFITPGNLLGIPGAVVPTGMADGLPMSVQVYADRFRDDLALQAAEIIEEAAEPLTPINPVRG